VRIRVLAAALVEIHIFREMTPYLLVRICLSAQHNISENMSFGRTDATDILYLTANVWT